MILGNQKKRLQSLFEEEYGGERLQKEPRVKPSFAGFSLHATLSGKGSYADLSENKSQNRGSYLSFRIFAGCASNKVVLKEGNRCNFLDMSWTIAGNWIAIDLLCAKLDNMGAIPGFWTVFFLAQNRGHYNLPCLNFYGKFEVAGYWTRARCNFVQFLQG